MADCTGFILPFDLECLLVNFMAGSMDLFILIAIIAIAGLGARFRMINSTLLIMFCLFAIIMAQFMSGFYFLVILIAGISLSFIIGRIAKG